MSEDFGRGSPTSMTLGDGIVHVASQEEKPKPQKREFQLVVLGSGEAGKKRKLTISPSYDVSLVVDASCDPVDITAYAYPLRPNTTFDGEPIVEHLAPLLSAYYGDYNFSFGEGPLERDLHAPYWVRVLPPVKGVAAVDPLIRTVKLFIPALERDDPMEVD